MTSCHWATRHRGVIIFEYKYFPSICRIFNWPLLFVFTSCLSNTLPLFVFTSCLSNKLPLFVFTSCLSKTAKVAFTIKIYMVYTYNTYLSFVLYQLLCSRLLLHMFVVYLAFPLNRLSSAKYQQILGFFQSLQFIYRHSLKCDCAVLTLPSHFNLALSFYFGQVFTLSIQCRRASLQNLCPTVCCGFGKGHGEAIGMAAQLGSLADLYTYKYLTSLFLSKDF